MLECVINVSEGRPGRSLDSIAAAAGDHLLDLHHDAHHNRAVLTLAGPEVEDAARAVATSTVELLDLRTHSGVHPRIGVLDVVPFVALEGASTAQALAARDRFARFAAEQLDLPVFLYGPERSLPELRAAAFRSISPDLGREDPHPSAGACAVGARGLLVAYNLWLLEADLTLARDLARSLRSPSVRALGLQVGERVQLSTNLIEPRVAGPADIYDAVAAVTPVAGAELVGLVPAFVLASVAPNRWQQLDLSEERTIEARLAERGRA